MTSSLTKFVIGFVGTTLTFLLLPRALKAVVRRWVVSLVGEIIAVLLAGLLTEKAVDKLSKP